MSNSNSGISGAANGLPATPGSYGEAPKGFRLPNDTRLAEVRLRVADLSRSVTYYESVLGMRLLRRDATNATLGAFGDDRPLLELDELKGARPVPRRGRTGLFHFAILLPDRPSLGRFVRHLGEIGAEAGAGDHLVSEALYLYDPDGLGIEVYADRPRESWRRVDRELMMATDPVDIDGLIQSAGETRWTGMPPGTVMGHVHLHVASIEKAAAFFSDALGFDRMVWRYPGALFFGAGGYHHHLGTNIWAGANAEPMRADEAGLIEWTIEVPDARAVDAAAASLIAGEFAASREGLDLITADPFGTAIRLRVGRQ